MCNAQGRTSCLMLLKSERCSAEEIVRNLLNEKLHWKDGKTDVYIKIGVTLIWSVGNWRMVVMTSELS